MFFSFKNHTKLILIILLFILNSCKLQEPTKNHGILFLENRANKLIVNKDNTNDVIKLIGSPHIKSINSNEWIYIERVLTKGKFIKLGQNVLKENNVLVLSFDKYGVLESKIFLDKTSKKKLKFSEKETENSLSDRSFVEKFLERLRKKMYKK